MSTKILIVDDAPLHGAQLKTLLESSAYQVLGPAPDCSAALELIWQERPDLAFVATHLGSQTCEAVLEECDLQNIPVVISAFDSLPEFCAGRDSVRKPFETEPVSAALLRFAS